MGVTTLFIEVANIAKPDARERLEFTVDSGAVYSVVPASVLRRLKIRSLKRETFRRANGATIVRRKGGALSFDLSFDPIRRELKPMTLIL